MTFSRGVRAVMATLLAVAMVQAFVACGSSAPSPVRAVATAASSASPRTAAGDPAETAGVGADASDEGDGDASSALRIGINSSGNAKYLVDPDGRALYVSRDDPPDTSACAGSCAATWRPLTVGVEDQLVPPPGAPGSLSRITRPDGQVQVTYDHRPLYYYAGDSRPGQTSGDGVDGVWSLARP